MRIENYGITPNGNLGWKVERFGVRESGRTKGEEYVQYVKWPQNLESALKYVHEQLLRDGWDGVETVADMMHLMILCTRIVEEAA